MKSFEVHCMQSDCPAVMHASLNNEPLFALVTTLGLGNVTKYYVGAVGWS